MLKSSDQSKLISYVSEVDSPWDDKSGCHAYNSISSNKLQIDQKTARVRLTGYNQYFLKQITHDSTNWKTVRLLIWMIRPVRQTQSPNPCSSKHNPTWLQKRHSYRWTAKVSRYFTNIQYPRVQVYQFPPSIQPHPVERHS